MSDTVVRSPLTQPFHFVSDGFGIEPKVYASGKGKKVYSGVAVFRSGTFRDSMGVQNTWEDLHIKQMLDNYDYLVGKNIFTGGAPVRDGHQAWLVGNIPGRGEVVGWHQDLKRKTLTSPVDGTKYEYLLADYEITQEYAQTKIESGTWRNRSAEIGAYLTNNETELWPVYLGFAWVDFSAVEGLNFSPSQGGRFYSFFADSTKETSVTDTPGNTGAPAPVLPFQPPVQHTAPQPQPQAQPAPVAPFVFSINGQNVSDYNAVQAYVNQLEGFIKETREASRKNFVAALVTGNKITSPQQPGMEAFALSLNDDQYDAWMKGWELAPQSPILGQHTSGVSNPNNTAQSGAKPDALQTARDIVKMHERNNMPIEQLKKTASYQALVTAGEKTA